MLLYLVEGAGAVTGALYLVLLYLVERADAAAGCVHAPACTEGRYCTILKRPSDVGPKNAFRAGKGHEIALCSPLLIMGSFLVQNFNEKVLTKEALAHS